MIKIKSESKIDIDKLDYDILELPNELLSKTLKHRQKIVKDFNKKYKNYDGVKRVYNDFIKKLIDGKIIKFKLPKLLTDKYVPNDKIPQLEMEVIKEFEKVLKTKLKTIK